MKYSHVEAGVFIRRPNRFIAQVNIQGREETVHVKNTGRCQELLVPETTCYLEKAANPNRKTKWDLIAVNKQGRLINMDSQVCNRVVQEFLEKETLFPNITRLKPETRWGNSRFDFYVEYGLNRKAFIEVKGVTLEKDGLAFFPDAPTLRGIKHIQELEKAHQEGYETYLFFVIQMEGITSVSPNWQTHPAFGQALEQAAACGLKILCYDCLVQPDEIEIHHPLPFLFHPEASETC